MSQRELIDPHHAHRSGEARFLPPGMDPAGAGVEPEGEAETRGGGEADAPPAPPAEGADDGMTEDDGDTPSGGGDAQAADDAHITVAANELACAYQAGRTEALAELFGLLRPLLQYPLGRYGHGRRGLPSTLDMDDLHQQSWLILDSLARRWDPAVGDFPAYVRRTFSWELWRYVRSLSPSRRARAVRVDNVQHDDLLDRIGEQPGADGRSWDDDLITTELLAELDPLARWTLLLHILEDRSLDDVARALELTQATAYQTYRRALDWLRLRADLDMDPDDALAREPAERPAVERLVEALHAGAGPGRRLPGRASVCARAKLSEVRFARLMGLLIELGCVEGRSARKPGRLVHATPAETLAHLRHETARIAAEV